MSIFLPPEALPAPRHAVRNFAWVTPGQVARGEQPALTDAALGALRDAGLTALLSLRRDREPIPGEPAYLSAAEAAACARVGLAFYHVPLADYHAPSPAQVTGALAILDRVTAAGGATYIHCHAGVGRTGVIAAAWALSRGASGDWAAAQFVHFFDDLFRRRGIPPQDRAGWLARWTVAHQLWAVHRLASVLSVPVNEPLPGYPAPQEPPYAVGWEYETVARRP